jgi:mRNA-degrading endonuclease toxin of MazEF toxin-antitoxin module
MRRGDIWTGARGKEDSGKPHPVAIVQDDSFDATDSITICAFTTDDTEAPLFRLAVEPNERNGLRTACRLMVDKIATVPQRQGRRACRQVGRRRHLAAQSGDARVSRTGGFSQDQAGGVRPGYPQPFSTLLDGLDEIAVVGRCGGGDFVVVGVPGYHSAVTATSMKAGGS